MHPCDGQHTIGMPAMFGLCDPSTIIHQFLLGRASVLIGVLNLDIVRLNFHVLLSAFFAVTYESKQHHLCQKGSWPKARNAEEPSC